MILRPTYLRPPGELAHPHGAEVPAEPAPQRVPVGEGDLATLQPRVESRVLIQLGMVIIIITIIITIIIIIIIFYIFSLLQNIILDTFIFYSYQM